MLGLACMQPLPLLEVVKMYNLGPLTEMCMGQPVNGRDSVHGTRRNGQLTKKSTRTYLILITLVGIFCKLTLWKFTISPSGYQTVDR